MAKEYTIQQIEADRLNRAIDEELRRQGNYGGSATGQWGLECTEFQPRKGGRFVNGQRITRGGLRNNGRRHLAG